MSNKVFVLDTNHRPLNPINPGRARILLGKGEAAVHKTYPFTIILKYAVPDAPVADLRAKLDPGSITTGIAVVDDETGEVVFAAELEHRGQRISAALADRRKVRRNRRARHTRYRQPRFLNRTKPKGWLAPSLMSRVHNTITWVQRLRELANITAISQELVRFDTQAMTNPDISAAEYQQGTLAGYDLREFLLEKWGRKCAYCGQSGVPLEIEHITPKSRGGSSRESNLTLACHWCNQNKGDRTAAEFGHPNIQKRVLKPLRDAAAVNATRWELNRQLKATNLPVEVGSGGLTKYNRVKRDLPKAHWIDAACVGSSTPEMLLLAGITPLRIKAMGWGRRQMCVTDRYGFPRQHKQRQKVYFGFQTGDIVRANVPKGKYAGIHVGRVVVRARGSFVVNKTDVNYRYCQAIQRLDGYEYRYIRERSDLVIG